MVRASHNTWQSVYVLPFHATVEGSIGVESCNCSSCITLQSLYQILIGSFFYCYMHLLLSLDPVHMAFLLKILQASYVSVPFMIQSLEIVPHSRAVWLVLKIFMPTLYPDCWVRVVDSM
nr:uncharacterized protein LOC113697324 [Coffea arabica]